MRGVGYVAGSDEAQLGEQAYRPLQVLLKESAGSDQTEKYVEPANAALDGGIQLFGNVGQFVLGASVGELVGDLALSGGAVPLVSEGCASSPRSGAVATVGMLVRANSR